MCLGECFNVFVGMFFYECEVSEEVCVVFVVFFIVFGEVFGLEFELDMCVIDVDFLNVFVMLGGQIVIIDDLIELMCFLEELVGVLVYESVYVV